MCEHASGERQEQYVVSAKNSIHSVDEAGDRDWWAQSDGSQREEDLCMVRAADRVMTVRCIERKITKKKAPPGGFKNVQEMPSSSNVCQAAHDKC